MRILIVLPIYNEELVLEKNTRKVLDFCRENLGGDEFKIVLADNKSDDRTGEIGKWLAEEENEVDYFFIPQKGKGIAIRNVWQKYDSDSYVFMDADLATDLSALPALVEAIKSGNDLAIGCRGHKDSKVKRSFLRGLVSFGYRLVLKIFLKLKIIDIACGFKAVSRRIRDEVVPQIKDEKWFFDHEMVILAEKQRYKIKEVPVVWEEFRDEGRHSKLNVMKDSWEYFKNILKMRGRI